MNNQNGAVFWIFENALDALINFLVLLSSYALVFFIINGVALNLLGLGTQIAVYIPAVISGIIYRVAGLYRPVSYFGIGYPYHRLALVNLLYFSAFLIVALFFSESQDSFYLFWISLSFTFSTAFLFLKKSLIVLFVRAIRYRRAEVKKVIIIGDNTDAIRAFVKETIRSGECVMILGAVGKEMHSDAGCELLGDIDRLSEILDSTRPDLAVFALDYYDRQKLVGLVNLCDERCVKVYFLPVIFGFFKSTRQVERVGALPLINVHATPLDNRFNAFLKRIIDIFGSIALIILTSPIMLAAAVGVRVTSGSPVLFKQKRVGKMGRRFTMLKFRSMRESDTSNTQWTTSRDPRKTRFGTFMRRTAIDELPQLFNVLVGSMSLVGPRPEIPHFVNEFKGEIPLYMVKHYAKPGITGLAQIRGLRGDTSVDERILADIDYIENWSLLLDIIILLKTPFKAFNKNERYVSEGEDEK